LVLEETGRPVIVFSNSTNRHLEVPIRAESWEEVERSVRDHYAEWRKQKGVDEEPPPEDEPAG